MRFRSIIPIKLLFGFLFLLMISGCRECEECKVIPYNDVNVQIQNNTGWDFKNVHLGSYMDDPESNKQCLRTGHFIRNGIKDGESSSFYLTAGRHLGYDRVIANIVRPEGYTRSTGVFLERLKAELLKQNATEDSIENVFSGEMMYGLALPSGDYIFEIILAAPDSLKSMLVNITQE